MYPAGDDLPKGKIRLMYEAAPLAWMFERAGGKSATGTAERILDIQPENVHDRCPIIFGSSFEVDKFEEFRLEEFGEVGVFSSGAWTSDVGTEGLDTSSCGGIVSGVLNKASDLPLISSNASSK